MSGDFDDSVSGRKEARDIGQHTPLLLPSSSFRIHNITAPYSFPSVNQQTFAKPSLFASHDL